MLFGSGDRTDLQKLAPRLDQITSSLAALTSGLAALKQQVDDQQHAISEARHETSTAITTGLAEIRAVARDAINRSHDLLTDKLAQIGGELVTVNGGINLLDSQLKTKNAVVIATVSTPEPAPAADTAQAAGSEKRAAGDAESAMHRGSDDAPAVQAAPDPEPEPAGEQPPTPPEPAPPAAPEPDPTILRAAAGIAHATVKAQRDTWAFLIQTAGNESHFHIPGKVKERTGSCTSGSPGPASSPLSPATPASLT